MEKKIDVLVIGCGPAGMVCALTARKYYPEKSIMIMKDVKEGVVPCGIPYMISSLKSPQDNAAGIKPLSEKNISVVIDRAIEIDRGSKAVLTEQGDQYIYDKLVLAVGSTPIIPPIPGVDQAGIFQIKKNMPYLLNMVKEIKALKRVLVVGGGFIGIEIADELSHLEGHQVYLVELMPRLLSNSFDPEFSNIAQEQLQKEGVTVMTGVKATEFIGDGRVKKVRFSNGDELDIDAVIIGIGADPNIELAVKADLVLKGQKGIWVDEYLRTIDPDIFAIGDCATKRDFYTRKGISVMLASTATAEARVAGANLFKLKVIRENKGTIAIYSTYVNGLVLGSAGLTENTAEHEGFEIAVGIAEAVDKHPASMPDVSPVKIKLIFSKGSGIILGGQVAGGITSGEIINIIGMAIQKRDSLTELETLQMATHPWLTTAPTKYPLVMAALAAEGERIV